MLDSAKGQWDARACRRAKRTGRVTFKLGNARKTAVFHDAIPRRRYSQSVAGQKCWRCKLTVAVALVNLCVLCCCTLYTSCETVVLSVQCATEHSPACCYTQRHFSGSYHRNSQPSGTLFRVGFVVNELSCLILPDATRSSSTYFDLYEDILILVEALVVRAT